MKALALLLAGVFFWLIARRRRDDELHTGPDVPLSI
jgi:hypothetical protein